MMIEFDSHTLWVKVKKQEGIGKMKFSLIIGTLNRCRELEICLESLRKQVFRDFEVIIIDQSINDSTQQLANGYQDLNIIYEHVDFMGLSKARNYALKMAHGDYFALIDDDAYYDERYLWEADKVLNDDREMILVGNIVQKSMLKKYSSKKQLKAIGYHQIMKNCPSPVLVFPYTLYCKGICFDENFGVGATFGACEETDLILEALDNKYQMCVTLLPLCVGLFLVANHAVIFLYGAEFQPTALTIRLLCPLILIKGFGDLYCYQMAYASKNEKIIVPASATASAINVATNAVLIPSLMQNGAVIASVASELITNMVQFVYMKKKVKFKLNMKPLVQSIITVAAMAVCVWKVGTLNFSNTVLLALEVIVGSVVYVVLNILMKNQLMLEVINMTKQRIHNATKKRI